MGALRQAAAGRGGDGGDDGDDGGGVVVDMFAPACFFLLLAPWCYVGLHTLTSAVRYAPRPFIVLRPACCGAQKDDTQNGATISGARMGAAWPILGECWSSARSRRWTRTSASDDL